MWSGIKLAILVFTLLGDWLREQKIRNKLKLEDEKRLEDAANRWRNADPDSVQPDDPELFSD